MLLSFFTFFGKVRQKRSMIATPFYSIFSSFYLYLIFVLFPSDDTYHTLTCTRTLHHVSITLHITLFFSFTFIKTAIHIRELLFTHMIDNV